MSHSVSSSGCRDRAGIGILGALFAVAGMGVLPGATCCFGPACGTSAPICNGGVDTPLYAVVADLSIVQAGSSADATVTARLTDACGVLIRSLKREQAVEINGVALTGPNGGGNYTATLPRAGTFSVTVREPTRGVETTDVSGPADFAIASPPSGGSASLSGFTLMWSGADPGLAVDITLSQSLLGQAAGKTFTQADTGMRAFSAADLRDFRQGAPVTVIIRKRSMTDTINGFRSASARIDLSQNTTFNPGP